MVRCERIVAGSKMVQILSLGNQGNDGDTYRSTRGAG